LHRRAARQPLDRSEGNKQDLIPRRLLSRASQDLVADSSAIAAEVLTANPLVQSYVQERREAARFDAATEAAFDTANSTGVWP
jgi:ABC-type multidrug transport system fused ATPase/permease subunit